MEATIIQTKFEQGYMTEFSMNDLDYPTQGNNKLAVCILVVTLQPDIRMFKG